MANKKNAAPTLANIRAAMKDGNRYTSYQVGYYKLLAVVRNTVYLFENNPAYAGYTAKDVQAYIKENNLI